MNQLLKDRVAVVTGAGRGIGREIAKSLAAQGASVLIADNGATINGKAEEGPIAEQVAAEIGGNAVAWTETVATPDAARAMVDLALDRFGAIDILVNNAAILRNGFLFKLTPDDWDATIDINLNGAFYVLNAVTPAMRQQAKAGRGGAAGWGRIINLGSTVAFYGNYGQSCYAASKGGLASLTRVTALEMAQSKVTANLIAPFAATRVAQEFVPSSEEQELQKQRTMRLSPHHIANVATWLCTDDASQVSGQIFGVRGREVMLFSQPAPVARLVSQGTDWTPEALASAAAAHFDGKYTELQPDLHAFNSEPHV